MLKSKFALAAIVALVFSLLLPTGAALSESNVTKSFTILKANGTPYGGVSVALLGYDDTLRIDVVSPLATTNALGKASIAISSSETLYYGFAVQPASGDYSHAVYVDYGVQSGLGQAFSVKMKPANLVVELIQTSGLSAAPGSWVSFPGTGDAGEPNSFRPVIRSGPIPIAIGNDIDEGSTYPIRIDLSGSQSQFGAEFGLKVDRVSGANIFTLFTDVTSTAAITPRVVAGVSIYDLRFVPSNLTGQLVSESANYSLPAGVDATVQFFRANEEGNFDPTIPASAVSPVLSNGAFAIRLYKLTEGKYFPFFMVSGSHVVPSFIGQPLFINSAGDYSGSESSGFIAPTAFSLASLVPSIDEINLKLAVVSPTGDGAPETASIHLTQNNFVENIFHYWGSGFSVSGTASYVLPDGEFSLILSPKNPAYISRDLLVTVTQGVVFVTENGVEVPAGDANVYSLSPRAPNTQLTILAGDAPANNVLVSVQRDGTGFIAGGVSDANGVVRLNIPHLEGEEPIPFTVRVQPDSNPELALSFTTTFKTFASGEIFAEMEDGTFSDSIALATPNFLATVSGPASNSAAVRNAWVDYYDETNDVWGNGSNSGTGGLVSLNMPLAPAASELTYRINVNPPWNSTELLGIGLYFVKVDSQGVTEVRAGSRDGAIVQPLNGVYALTLAAPSVKGTVTTPDGIGVRDSYVSVFKNLQGMEQWLQGGSTRSNGKFGLVVPNGSYDLYANSPWHLNGLAKSARCQVVVSGGALDVLSSGTCASTGEVRLALRSPNLKFKLVDGSGAVANASVNIQIGNWNTWAQSGPDGSIALFIDNADIASKNLSSVGSDVNITVDPPYGNNEVVRWSCSVGEQKPLCSALAPYFTGQIFNPRVPQLTLPDVVFATPNTRLTVLAPDGQPAGAGAWVSLFYEEDGWRRWIAGAITSSQGEAVFNVNVEEFPSEAKFAVEVNAPWGKRQEYSQLIYTNLLLPEVNEQQFRLGTPNLKLTVNQANGVSVSQWSWVQVEEVDSSSFDTVAWLGGYSTNEYGQVALTLPADKTVRITVYPGPGSIGARTSCILALSGITVNDVPLQCPENPDASVTDGAITLALSAGNVTGKVTNTDLLGLAGAVVFAQAYSAVSGSEETGKTEQTVSAADGRYGLQLDPTYDWKIQVFYVKPEDQMSDYESAQPLLVWDTSSRDDKFINFPLELKAAV